jgi:hypothetical protein
MFAFAAPVIAFFTSAVGRYVLIGVMAVAIWGHGYFKGGAHVRAQCEEKARQAQVAADKQDKTAQQQIIVQEKTTDAELEELAKKQAARIKELEANASVTSPSCTYPLPPPTRQPARGVRAQPARP